MLPAPFSAEATLGYTMATAALVVAQLGIWLSRYPKSVDKKMTWLAAVTGMEAVVFVHGFYWWNESMQDLPGEILGRTPDLVFVFPGITLFYASIFALAFGKLQEKQKERPWWRILMEKKFPPP